MDRLKAYSAFLPLLIAFIHGIGGDDTVQGIAIMILNNGLFQTWIGEDHWASVLKFFEDTFPGTGIFFSFMLVGDI